MAFQEESNKKNQWARKHELEEKTEDSGIFYFKMWTLYDKSFQLRKRLLSKERDKTILHRIGQEGLNCSKENLV